MTSYSVTMMDAENGGGGSYQFEAEEELMAKTPVRIVRRFMEHVDKKLLAKQHVDYELNAAFKHPVRNVVMAMGSLELEHEPPLPFVMMISPTDEAGA